MPLTLDGLPLVGAQESDNTSEGKPEITSTASQPSEDTLVVSMKAVESQPLSGTATGIRLASDPNYSDDPRVALSQWVQQFNTLVSANQGDGWELTDDERDRSINVITTGRSWTMASGAPFEVQWELSLERGEGVFDDGPRQPTSATPADTPTLDGTDLGTITEMRSEANVEVELEPIAYGDTSDTIITPQSGIMQRFTMTGRVGGSPSELRTFDDTLRSYVGLETAVTYQSAFPGTEHTTIVDQFESSHTGGQPGTMTYTLSLIEGLAL